VGAILPSLVSLAIFPGYGVFVAVVILITVMELISNNIVEPWLYGTSTGISAVAVIVAAVVWGWLWGPVGLLLSTPLTVCLVVLGQYVPRFKIFATLFGEHLKIKNSIRFYQRLLAGDAHRANEILEERIKESDFDLTCDEVLIPTLKRIRTDQEAEFLNEKDANRLFAQIGGLIEKLENVTTLPKEDEAMRGGEGETSEPEQTATVIGCTSHHLSESLIINLLRIGGAGSYQLQTFENHLMPSEQGKEVAAKSPAAVAIMVLPKGGFAQARNLCKHIREEGYTGVIVVACFGKFKNYNRLYVKFHRAGATYMTTSFTQTRFKLETVSQRVKRDKRPATTLL